MTDDANDNDDLATQLDEAWARLCDGQTDAARAHIDALKAAAPEDPRVAALEGELLWELGELEAAQSVLLAAIRRAPMLADAHHRLARIYEAQGEENLRRRHDLLVHGLDAALDRRLGPLPAAAVRHAAEAALARVPAPFRARLENVPIVLEPRPSRREVREGLDPRTLGLFDGTPYQATSALGEPVLSPTRIVLFTANLTALTADEAVLAEEVETTLLHEIAHFFGLDEDEVAALGLA